MSDFEKWREQLREAGCNGWDTVADPLRELRIIRGEPVEWAEHAVAMFEDIRNYQEGAGNSAAAGVAQMAVNKFRELLE